jgi:hypothetical protein
MRKHVGIVVLPKHKEALRLLAEANGEAMSVTMRRLIREEAQRRGLWPFPGDVTQDQPQEAEGK